MPRVPRALRFFIVAIGAGLILPFVIYAAAHTITYTTAQDNLITSKGIPAYNRAKCARYGRPPACTATQLTQNGCVPVTVCQAAGLVPTSSACTTTSTIFTEQCQIFTADLAGSDAMFLEVVNRSLVEVFLQGKSQESTDYKNAFNSADAASQQAACTALGLPANCQGPGQ